MEAVERWGDDASKVHVVLIILANAISKCQKLDLRSAWMSPAQHIAFRLPIERTTSSKRCISLILNCVVRVGIEVGEKPAPSVVIWFHKTDETKIFFHNH